MSQNPYRSPDLGEPLAVHRFTIGWQLQLLALFFLGLPATGLLLVAIGAMPLGENWNVMSYVGAALFCVAMPAMGVYLLIDARARRDDVVRVHERGVEVVTRGSTQFIAWTDVESLTSEVKQTVTNGVPGPVTHRHVLATPAGSVTFTHGFEDIQALAALLRSKTLEVLEPRIQQKLLAKQAVTFGPLSLTLQGVVHGGRTLPWKDAVTSIEEGHLVLGWPDGRRLCHVPVSEVPNFHVLVELLERMRARL